MSNNLLRRPLPPLKKGSKATKTDDLSEKHKNHYLGHQKGNETKQHVINHIFENGDCNWMKPLGPQPFFNTKWHSIRKNQIILGQPNKPPYGCWPDSAISQENNFEDENPKSQEKHDMKEDYLYEESTFDIILKDSKGKEKQDAVRIVNIESEKIPKATLRKPWRQVLLEQTDQVMNWNEDESDRFEKFASQMCTSCFSDPNLTNRFISEKSRSVSVSPVKHLFHKEKELNLADGFISEKSRSVSVSPEKHLFQKEKELNPKNSKDFLNNILKEVEDKSEDRLKSTGKLTSEEYNLYQQAKEEIERNLITHKSQNSFDIIVTMNEEVDYDTDEEHTKLNLKAQFLNTVPDLSLEVFLSITWVNLAFNNFNEFPVQIFQAENLVYLNMRNNPMFEIPDNIPLLKKLKYVNFSFCCIHEVNERVYELKELEVLDVSYNRIVELSDKIRKLQSLKELYIDGNQIRALPKNILKLNLSFFHCSSNFLNKSFWAESCRLMVQSLFEISLNTILSYGVKDRRVIKKQFGMTLSSEKCDYCNGPKPLVGVLALKPVVELFGAKNIPIMFYVCSQSCRKKLITAPQLPCHLSDKEDDEEEFKGQNEIN